MTKRPLYINRATRSFEPRGPKHESTADAKVRQTRGGLEVLRTIFVNRYELAVPAVAEAARLLTRHRVCEVRVIDGLPPTSYVVEVPKEAMQNAKLWNAINTLVGEETDGEKLPTNGVIVRYIGEVPSGSEAAAKARGFSDDEIRETLRPWVAEGKRAAEAAVKEAEKNLVDAHAFAARHVAEVEARDRGGKDGNAPNYGIMSNPLEDAAREAGIPFTQAGTGEVVK